MIGMEQASLAESLSHRFDKVCRISDVPKRLSSYSNANSLIGRQRLSQSRRECQFQHWNHCL